MNKYLQCTIVKDTTPHFSSLYPEIHAMEDIKNIVKFFKRLFKYCKDSKKIKLQNYTISITKTA